ncbi:uncharacterized protein [Parasteatoda tepidariorum]|uniref:uncharacterized protein n=1 Tax=Parasteatoda tepidariorum TaxID=114398 RepID=UPI001C718D19|nr:uncharacterized protein LOC122271423 [Parasteatoda tepidariorum]
MASNGLDMDAETVDRELKKHYGIQDCYVHISRLSDSIFLPTEGNSKELYKYGNKRLKYSSDEYSETESDFSTSHSDANEYQMIDIIERIDSYPENYFANRNCYEEKPFSVHYSKMYIDEIVNNIYAFQSHNVRFDLSEIFQVLKSDFTSLSETEFRTRVRERLTEMCYRSISEKFKSECRIAAERVLNQLAHKQVDLILGKENNVHPNTVKLTWSSCTNFILNKHIRISSRAHQYRKLYYDKESFVIVREEDVKYARKAIKRLHKLKVIVQKDNTLPSISHFNSCKNSLLIEN